MMRRDLLGLALVVGLVLLGEVATQGMIQRPWMAQLLAPGGDVGLILLVTLTLVLRLLVVVVLPGLLVGRLLWRALQPSRSRR